MTTAGSSNHTSRVCLVGAGKVAQMHAPALMGTPGVELAGVCDPDQARAGRLAERYGVPAVFRSCEEAIASGSFDRAHVLVPPDRHVEVAHQLIEAGVGVLIEKPMAPSGVECAAMVQVADRRRVRLGVNHNSVFYPAYLRLRQAVMEQSYGALRHVVITLHRPRHWLTGAPSWLRDRPDGLVYESAVHPLAQLYDLAGEAREVSSLASVPHELVLAGAFVCERATAQVSLSYGEYHTYQVLAICHDGVLAADIEANRFTAIDRTRWGRTRFGPYLQPLRVARKAVAGELAHGLQNLIYELRPQTARARSDPYWRSMRESISSFHRGPLPGRASVDGEFGRQVVALCDQLTGGGDGAGRRSRKAGRPRRLAHPDVAVVGGTGHVGSALVEQLSRAGMTVRVIARHTGDLPSLFEGQSVELAQGDLAESDTAANAVRGARAVVHLADKREQIAWGNVFSALVEPTLALAAACVRAGVERMVCIGSITSLYLGERELTITGSTAVDIGASTTGPWEWGKARLEQLLRERAFADSLSLCVIRPGVVVGAGMPLRHPGLGIWRGETHCVGWNAGLNPLPLVLAHDVAAAIGLALSSEAAPTSTYNLVGDVRLSARECVQQLGAALERPLVFHPAHPAQHLALAVAKWSFAKARGRGDRPFPSYRAFASRGCPATFDCSDVKRELRWQPVTERREFIEQAFSPAR